MAPDIFRALKTPHFLTLFLVQFLSAFSENILRSALVILVSYDVVFSNAYDSKLLVPLIGGIAMLPFFLFSGLAGQLADKFEKARLIMIIKSLELLVCLLAIYGLTTKNLPVLLLVLFCLMTQASFFGPLKYSLVPFYLKKEEVLSANAMIETSTFLAILLGAILGGVCASWGDMGIYILATLTFCAAAFAWICSFYLGAVRPIAPENISLRFNLYKQSMEMIRGVSKDRLLFLSIIGISWFWVIGGIFLTQTATYGREVIGGNQHVVTFFMVIFTVGIGIGSFVCSRLSRSEINPKIIFWGAVGITVFILDLVITSHHLDLTRPDNLGIFPFLSDWMHCRISFDLMMIAVCGGLYTVPLYTILQTDSRPESRSRTIAVNNIINAFFMVVSTVVSTVLIALNVSILGIFLICALLNLFVMNWVASRLLPESLLQLMVQGVLKVLFRVEVKGIENFHAAGKRTLIIANHTSFLDAVLIFAFIPDRLSYAIYSFYIDKWWIRWIRSGIHLFPVDPTNPMAIRRLIEFVRQDRKCVIFPEGRITVTGALMKIYDGPGMVIDKAGASVLPIRIDGAQYTIFSRLKGVVRRQLLPKITLTILPPQHLTAPEAIKGRERRKIFSNKIYDIMVNMLFETSNTQTTLFASLIDAAKRHGMRREILEDVQRDPITYRQILMRSFILGKSFQDRSFPGERVGVLLPTSIAGFLSFFGLQSVGRIPTMLNFSLGSKNIIDTCTLARLRWMITSRRFVQMARLESMIEVVSQHIKIVYLEDLRESIGLKDKLIGAIKSFCPKLAYRPYAKNMSPQDTSVILFTSGSEGLPKAVALSHQNILSNRHQVISSIDFNAQDVVLNVLPMFHSFGLTGGILIPIFEGLRTFLYPSPLHFRIIPVIAYDINATIFFATDTFLNQYARMAHPYDFYATRYVFSGAEKLQESTRHIWQERFHLQVFEAYGATEASPGIAISSRMHSKSGAVGRFLPGIEYRLQVVPGIPQGGRLFIKGPNVMLGYIDSISGRVSPLKGDYGDGLQDGWYDTGDIVDVDDEGFVHVLGRMKRFAKIGGEMISLLSIEEHLSALWPNDMHMVLNYPDPRKGEQLILLTTGSLTRSSLMEQLKASGVSDLAIPRRILSAPKIPTLATGKIDLRGARTLADTLLSQENEQNRGSAVS